MITRVFCSPRVYTRRNNPWTVYGSTLQSTNPIMKYPRNNKLICFGREWLKCGVFVRECQDNEMLLNCNLTLGGESEDPCKFSACNGWWYQTISYTFNSLVHNYVLILCTIILWSIIGKICLYFVLYDKIKNFMSCVYDVTTAAETSLSIWLVEENEQQSQTNTSWTKCLLFGMDIFQEPNVVYKIDNREVRKNCITNLLWIVSDSVVSMPW